MSAKAHLDREFDRLEPHLPDAANRMLRWIRRPAARWVRIPAAVALMAGGFLGFLPILGFWMVPLGLALIAVDVPIIQRPLARCLAAVTRWLDRRSGRGGSSGASSSRPTSNGRPE